MNGVWRVDIYHFKSPRCKKGIALGVMMSDEDADQGNVLLMAVDKCVRQIKSQVEFEKQKALKKALTKLTKE